MKAIALMTSPPPWIAPDATIEEAVRRLGASTCDAPCLLVGREDQAPLGIVTQFDVLRAALRTALTPGRLPCARDAMLSPEGLAGPHVFDQMALASRDLLVRDIMSVPAIVIEEETSAAQVMDTLVRRRVDSLPVVRGGRVVGLVRRTAILEAVFGAIAAASAAGGVAGGG